MTERPEDIHVHTAGTTRLAEDWRYRRMIHWPSIVAGAFIALSLFVISAVLAWACGVDFTFNTVRSTGREAASIIWGAVTAIIAFGLGAYIAGMVAATRDRGIGLLNGLMVWAVAVPLLFYFLGTGIGPQLGQTAAGVPDRSEALPAAAHIGGPAVGAPAVIPETTNYVGHYQAAAWWMLCSLGLGLVGALGCGYAGAESVDRDLVTPRTVT